MERRRAIVVGVRDYTKAEVGNLAYSANDAARLARILVERAKFGAREVALFHDGPVRDGDLLAQPPHRSDILATIQRFADECTSEDLLVFFFAGHGGEISGEPYLLTNDTRMNVIDKTALNIREINEALDRSKGRCILRFVDACRVPIDGARDALSRPMSPGFAKAISSGGAASVVFSACSSGEFSYEHPDLEQGIFSYYLCQGLDGLAAVDGGDVTIEGLEAIP